MDNISVTPWIWADIQATHSQQLNEPLIGGHFISAISLPNRLHLKTVKLLHIESAVGAGAAVLGLPPKKAA